MPKPTVTDSRFDFRGGRNSAMSPDLLNDNELVDLTNARLTSSYGAITKKGGTQRIHSTAFPAPVMGVTQWDTLSGKQTVVISNGNLYWRNGFEFAPLFTQAAGSGVARTTAQDGTNVGWIDPDGTDDATNVVTAAAGASATVAAGNRLVAKLGTPAVNNNVDAADDLYTLKFIIAADGTPLVDDGGGSAVVTATVTLEYSVNDGGAWTALTGSYIVQTSLDNSLEQTFEPTVTISAAPAPGVWIRAILSVSSSVNNVSGNAEARVRVYTSSSLPADRFPVTWSTGAGLFSTTEPTFFMPFRASSSGAPLVLYMASGGHLFSWDGVSTLAQLDPANNAPLAKLLISYHTRGFATHKDFPKTIFWSRIGDATFFTTGAKTDGGSAVTDFLTGQALTALEVLGSSLLMATNDSVMRFTGHTDDDINIAQGTEGISAEVGSIGSQTLKRFENTAAMLSERGPYVVSETQTSPIGEVLQPDWQGLDQSLVNKACIEYHRGNKDLLFAVPRNGDGANKTIYAYSVRLQAWQGPWTYTFAINCMSKYFNSANAAPNVIAGCADGFVRLMDVGSKDDVLYDGTGGSNISMTIELPTIHFNSPGLKKSLRRADLQLKLPSGHNFKMQTAFDGDTLVDGSFVDTTADGTLRDYRVDLNGQGDRCRVVFTDDSAVSPTLNGMLLHAWLMNRP